MSTASLPSPSPGPPTLPGTPSSTDEGSGERSTEEFLAGVRTFVARSGSQDAAAILSDVEPPAAGEIMATSASGRPSPAVVVVVGETSRGKSTLLNTLLGRDDLLPEAADIASATYVMLRYGNEPGATVHLPGGKTHRIELGQLADAAGVTAELPAQWLDVQLDDQRLDGLILVDTPGIGGLSSGYGRLTLEALSVATALIFVSEAGAPLGQAEMKFLERASARIERVVLVLTKTDAHPAWRQIADDDRRLIAIHAPRFANSPLIGVSAAVAQSAAELAAHRPDLAEEVMGESGIPALWEEIGHIVGQRVIAEEANRIRAARSALDAVHREARRQATRYEHPSETMALVQRQQAEIERWKEDTDGWYTDLLYEFTKIRKNISRLLSQRRRALLAEFDEVQAANPKNRDAAPDCLVASVADLQVEVNVHLENPVRELILHLFAQAPEAGDPLLSSDLIDAPIDQSLSAPPGKDSKAARDGSGMQRVQTVYMGNNMAKTLLTTMASHLALGPVGIPVALAAGVAWSACAMKKQTTAVDKGALRSWAVGALSEAVEEMDRDIGSRLDDIQHEVTNTMRRTVPKRLEELHNQLAECKAALQQDQQQRQAALRKLNGQAEEALLLARAADQRLSALRAHQIDRTD